MEEAIQTKDKVIKFFKRKYTWTVIYGITIILYLLSLNIIYINVNPTFIVTNIDIISICTLFISIIILEKSYKDNGRNALSAVEFLILSIYLLLMNHISRIYSYDVQSYINSGLIFAISYYFFKTAILFTKEHKEKLNSLSDIRQIIKEEPIKKETKRKNVKN